MRKLTQEITYLNKEDLLNILFKHFGINETTSSIHIEDDIYSEEFITIVIKETIHTEDINKSTFIPIDEVKKWKQSPGAITAYAVSLYGVSTTGNATWGTGEEEVIKSLFKCKDCKDQGRWPGCEFGEVCSLFVMKK